MTSRMQIFPAARPSLSLISPPAPGPRRAYIGLWQYPSGAHSKPYAWLSLKPSYISLGACSRPLRFQWHPHCPPGIKVLAFDGLAERDSWAPHGVEAFYVGPAMNHYRCYEVHVSKTKRSRITDTLSWHSRRFIRPGASPLDTLTAAVGDLTVAVTTLAASPVALLPHRQPVRAACESLSTSLRTLQEIFTDPAILPPCGRTACTRRL
jgi:hypothetical protein